jgi:hypothetical protein
MRPEEVAKEAKKQLGVIGFTPTQVPTWHPYYWFGRLRAAEEMMENDRVRGSNNQRRVRRAAR